MATAMASMKSTSNARSVSFVGLTIAIMAVSAWVTVPLGPVPFTLQMFAIVFAIVVLKPREAIIAMAGYLLLGAVGLPVFSGMRGGLGILAGPTGGFLWGSLFGVIVASSLLHTLRSRFGLAKGRGSSSIESAERARLSLIRKAMRFIRGAACELVAGVVFVAISYVCGWAQLMVVAGLDPLVAFLVGCAPFVVVDSCKIIAAVACAQAVRSSVRS